MNHQTNHHTEGNQMTDLITTHTPERQRALTEACSSGSLSADSAQSIAQSFAPHFAGFSSVRDEARSVAADAPNAARVIRLKLKNIRIASAKTHKDLKEDSLLRGRAIDGFKNILAAELVPVEKALDEIERAEEIKEAKRKVDLKEKRAEELAPYADPAFFQLEEMPDAQYAEVLSGAKAAHALKIATQAKAEADAIEKAKAEAEAQARKDAETLAERERILAENKRLASEAAELKARADADAKARAEADAKATAERAAADAKAKADRDAIEVQAAQERAARERAEAELAAKADAEANAIIKAKAEADEKERQAAAAPDAAKVRELATAIRRMSLPKLSTETGLGLSVTIQAQLSKFAAWLDAEAGKL